ncbi:MAG: tetratricopeptide repeat protein [Armatimonadota bacterium]
MKRWLLVTALAAGLFACIGPLRAQTRPAANTTPPPAARPTVSDYIKDGDNLMKKNEYSSALSKYVMAWLETPDNAAVVERIGHVFYAGKKYTDAWKFYSFALKLNPGYEDAVVSLGTTYLRLNQADQALTLLEDPERQKTFSKSFRYQHVLGLAYMNQGKYDKAITALKNAITLAPTIGFVYGDLGNAYYLAKNYQEAVASYTTAIEKSPNDAVALLNRSLAEEKLGRFKDAASSLEKYLALSKAPDNDPQRKRLADLRAKADAEKK